MWGLTTYFNPARYRTRAGNYRAFRERSRSQGLRLVAVELLGEDGDPELREGDDAEVLVVKRSPAVLWHKERLLNLGLAALPRSCDHVCWLDADVLFEQPEWIERSAAELERHAVIQPFEAVIRLPRGGRSDDFPGSQVGGRIRKGVASGTYTPSFCAERARSRRRIAGTTGYAWCARRELLERHGFYDRCIVGGGDRQMALAFALPAAGVPPVEVRIRAPRLRAHVATWHDAIHAGVRGDTSFLPGVIHHLWHGEQKDRGYKDRHAILEQHDFDPERDIVLDGAGCWRWAAGAEALAADVAAYLESRKEDG